MLKRRHLIDVIYDKNDMKNRDGLSYANVQKWWDVNTNLMYQLYRGHSYVHLLPGHGDELRMRFVLDQPKRIIWNQLKKGIL